MSDTIKFHPGYTYEVFQVLTQLASVEPDQRKELRQIFFGMFNRFHDENIHFGNAEVFCNNTNPYQVEWPLFGEHPRCLGVLVFGRKLPTAYGQDPLRKFWLRSHKEITFGDLTPASLTEYHPCDYLYFHDHSEVRRLNKYCHGANGVVYRHESTLDKNRNWFGVSSVFSEQDVNSLGGKL